MGSRAKKSGRGAFGGGHSGKLPEITFRIPEPPAGAKIIDSPVMIGIALALVAVFAVLQMNPTHGGRGSELATQEWSGFLTPSRIDALSQAYPKGYQVFVIDGKDVIPLSVSTFPKSVKIDWGLSRVISRTEEKLRLNIYEISYPALKFSGPVQVDIALKSVEASAGVIINGVAWSVNMLSATQDQVLCVLALR